jgi:transposase
MYLRTTKRRNADGSEVRYFQLAENVWDAAKGCAVARVVYNFGRADQLDADSLRRLARSILRVVEDDEAQIRAQAPTGTAGPGGEPIRLRDSWPYGAVWALEQVWKQLEIDQVLEQLERRSRRKLPVRRALFAMVANRALAPCSKLYCFEQWMREEVFLAEARTLKLEHLYRSMDVLERWKQEVEKAVYFATADLMNADVDLVFSDTTSLHCEVDQEDEEVLDEFGRNYEPLRKRGHSKNGRDDALQLVIGLAVTRDGLPVRSWVFPGNTGDVTTVERVKEDLKGWRLGRCVFVGDAGMNSEENRRKLALGGGKYILASKMRAGDEVTREVLTRPGRYQQVAENLRVKQVLVGDGARRRRYVVCHNPVEQRRQRKHREQLVEQLGRELASLQPRSGQEHSKRVCELRTSRRFGRYVRQGDKSLVIDWKAVRQEERYDGKWVITSNDDTLTPEDLALGYKQLMRVEECWRQLKSGLRMRPVFHRRPWRIQAHVTISVLALLLERIIEIRARDTWRNVRDSLQTIKVVEYDRGGYRIRQTTGLRLSIDKLLDKLGMQYPPEMVSIEPVPTDRADRVGDLDSVLGAAPSAPAAAS